MVCQAQKPPNSITNEQIHAAHEFTAASYTQEIKKNPAKAGFFHASTKQKYRQRIENKYFSRKPFKMNNLQ
ncbi:hypothetical protein HDF14_004973 [Edaphobacter lichenicola]|uniref:Uncharacterized protein n=1 Tax=Tunturiibacter gelidiferens TaxID=3069689 RepID=A0A9X0U682_9BACT|nr:hypothetical protein [Edaphobacter lichenicola]